ncbi:MAG: ribonuclease Z [Chlorobi bacterium]|nr:ribonuclease Z [Chlorobiota bacterium]
MGDLELNILGNGSAVPTKFGNPSSQMLTYRGNQFLIDCGEGAQMQIIRYKVKYRRLNNIFISHLHGDHFFGLFGLLSTFHLFGRENAIDIFAPAKLKPLLDHVFRTSDTVLRFPLNFLPLEDFSDTPLLDKESFTIRSFKLKHSVPTYGFVFREKPLQRKINKEFIKGRAIKTKHILEIKAGSDYVDDKGILYKNGEISQKPRNPLSYAYCSDTAYHEDIVEDIHGVKLLYHEATFDESMLEMADDKKHSTAAQAARIAKLANVEKLLLGHFSARFKEFDTLLQQARDVFPNTFISVEGKPYQI